MQIRPSVFWSAIFLMLFYACQPEKPPIVEISADAGSQVFEADTFSRIPVSFASDGFALAGDEFSLGLKRYLFVFGRNEAVFRQKGQFISLKLEKRFETMNGESRIFSGNGFVAEVWLENNVDASGLQTGTLTFKTNDTNHQFSVVSLSGH